MNNFRRLAEGIDVAPALAQLALNPGLWDQNTMRKVSPGTPHSEMSDIWLRWRRPEELREPKDYLEPHFPVWYPAWSALTALHPIVRGFVASQCPVHLGGILITRIPPGGKIERHDDRGGWHAEYHNLKVYLPLASNARCINECDGEEMQMRPGELWEFNNLLPHAVENNGLTDRITLIISARVEGL